MEDIIDNNNEFNVHFEKNLYNIRKFMKNHPGGTNTLKNKSNQDVSKLMNAYGHSNYAYYLLEQYKSDRKLETDQTKTPLENGNGHLSNGDSHVGQNGFGEKNGMLKLNEERRKAVKNMEELEALVDWSKPMLGQLHKLGSNYHEWVHSPVDKKLTMFSSPFLESFTHTPWYVVPMFWVPILSYGIFVTYTDLVLCKDKCTRPSLSHFVYWSLFLTGILLWTLLEYSIHRWIFHFKPPTAVIWKQLHFLIHGLHHKVPFDEQRLVFPPIPALVIATAGYYGIIRPIFVYCDLMIIGIISGYLIYDMIHYSIHNTSPRDGSFLYMLKRYHAMHHFTTPFQGFGISNKIWDIFFDTTIKIKKLDISLTWD